MDKQLSGDSHRDCLESPSDSGCFRCVIHDCVLNFDAAEEEEEVFQVTVGRHWGWSQIRDQQHVVAVFVNPWSGFFYFFMCFLVELEKHVVKLLGGNLGHSGPGQNTEPRQNSPALLVSLRERSCYANEGLAICGSEILHTHDPKSLDSDFWGHKTANEGRTRTGTQRSPRVRLHSRCSRSLA